MAATVRPGHAATGQADAGRRGTGHWQGGGAPALAGRGGTGHWQGGGAPGTGRQGGTWHWPAGRGGAGQSTSAGVPLVNFTSSSKLVANMVYSSPPPAHTTGYAARAWSTTVRTGEGWPTGATPPTSWPV
jgi:hypothetical protein